MKLNVWIPSTCPFCETKNTLRSMYYRIDEEKKERIEARYECGFVLHKTCGHWQAYTKCQGYIRAESRMLIGKIQVSCAGDVVDNMKPASKRGKK